MKYCPNCNLPATPKDYGYCCIPCNIQWRGGQGLLDTPLTPDEITAKEASFQAFLKGGMIL